MQQCISEIYHSLSLSANFPVVGLKKDYLILSHLILSNISLYNVEAEKNMQNPLFITR